MDRKFYVSLEAARLLKEKGYNEECDCSIDDDNDIYECEYRTNQELPKWKWSCPTKAEAIDWLESKGMRINIIYDWIECKWYFTIINGYPKKIKEIEVSDSVFYKTRLEAEDAAIIKALELLKKGE